MKKCVNMKNSWTFQLNLRSRCNGRISISEKHLIQGIPIFRWNRASNTHELNKILSGHWRIPLVPSFHHIKLLYVVWESLHELPIRLVPKTRRCKWASDDQVLQSCRLPANFEFGSQYSTPWMTSEIEPILDVEVIENIDELVDEYVDGPEGWRLFLELPVCRFRDAGLIVEDNRNTVFVGQLWKCRW